MHIFPFSPVMDYDSPLPAINLSDGYNHHPEAPELQGAGGYMEYRRNMYTSPLFAGKRYIHMGVDIWGPAGAAVYAFADGIIWGFRDNNTLLNYGPTIVTRHSFGEYYIYALYGHLSRNSLDMIHEGREIKAGQRIGELGGRDENGGWIPHLHFQISGTEPVEPDMPGVVGPDELEEAVKKYPDPRMVLGPIYL